MSLRPTRLPQMAAVAAILALSSTTHAETTATTPVTSVSTDPITTPVTTPAPTPVATTTETTPPSPAVVTETAPPQPEAVQPDPPLPEAIQPKAAEVVTTPTQVRLSGGLVYDVLKQGTGAELTTGTTAMIHYRLTSDKGDVWDDSRARPVPRPFKFDVGSGFVVKGMEQGTIGMRVGERRRILVPPALGYGDRKSGGIPPNSNLHFDVELVDVIPTTAKPSPENEDQP